MSSNIDHQKIGRIITQVCEEQILPRFRNLSADDIEMKSDHASDVVTIADKDAEAALKQQISSLYPQARFIGEESSHSNPAELDALTDGGAVWVIDPLDGTTNFKNGVEKFGTILSYIENGEILHGWIYNPISKMMVTAQKGAGTWCGSQRLSVSQVKDISQTRAMMSLQFFPEDEAGLIADRAEKTLTWQNNYGSVAIDYQAVVKAQTDFALFNYIRVWDHAAGILMHREAGGYAAKLDGSSYQVTDESGGLLLAPSKDLWDGFHKEILSYRRAA